MLGLFCQPALPSVASPEPLPGKAAVDGPPLASPLLHPFALEKPQQGRIEAPPVGQPPGALDITQPEPAEVSPLLRPGSEPTANAEPALVSGTYLTSAAALAVPATSARFPTVAPSTPHLAQTEEEEDLPTLDPELGVVQVRGLLEDNDLGILRIRQQPEILAPTQQSRPKFGFFQARMTIASSDNVLLAVNDVGGLTGDTFLRPSIGLAVYPSLGPRTAFIATADLGLQRYVSQSSLNYDDLRFRVGIRQGLTPRSYGQIIFGYQELFRPGGDRRQFFKNTSLGLSLGRRDPISPGLNLESYYLLQFNGAQSNSGTTFTDFSRLFQTAGAYLGYDITPRLQTGISYQLNLIDYTAQDRYDTFQQVLGQLAYRITPAVRLSIYGGFSFGRSSEPAVQFNDTFFGAAIEATVPLF